VRRIGRNRSCATASARPPRDDPNVAEAIVRHFAKLTIAFVAKRSPARPAADECFVAQRKVIDV
jgi:hypothetical protein